MNRLNLLTCCLVAGLSLLLPHSTTMGEDASPRQLRVLSFNILNDAARGGIEQTAEVMKASRADVIGIQEVHKIGPKLAEMTGFTFVKQPKGGILTRLKVLEKSKAGFGLKLELEGGESFWMYNVHLHHAPYGPYQLNGIPYLKEDPFVHTPGEAIAESVRARSVELAAIIMDMGPALLAKEKIVLTGDFNEPSHLDWTEEAVAAKLIPVAVKWPQSRLVEDSGFRDAFREIYPDPVAKPGYTWTPTPSARDVLDRIDFVYHIGFKPKTAEVVGEAEKTSDIVVTPYPSDHRSVVVEFSY
ncbi:endonuclease/exonuclease/phosphatase family protein [Planctomicrobium sp. SH668]|uniref:endonuclease/exonuclease/phosphatase family protein n=1 Tax=Planctomicrobium sp. SH668 TaxID=3448126 RepID=UPI003F5B12F5